MSTTLNEYQMEADQFRLPEAKSAVYAALGLVGEAGEVAQLYKKAIRKGQLEPAQSAVLDEIGDVLWYVAAVAHSAGLTLEEVANYNLMKLSARKEAGEIAERVKK